MQWAPLRTPSPPLQMRGQPASCHGRLQALPARLPCSLLPSEFPLFAPSLAPMAKMGTLGGPPEGVFLLLILVFSTVKELSHVSPVDSGQQVRWLQR